MTIWRENVDRFIARRDDDGDQVRVERERAIAQALAYLTAANPRPGRALYEMSRSVLRQARMSGIGDLQLGTAGVEVLEGGGVASWGGDVVPLQPTRGGGAR